MWLRDHFKDGMLDGILTIVRGSGEGWNNLEQESWSQRNKNLWEILTVSSASERIQQQKNPSKLLVKLKK